MEVEWIDDVDKIVLAVDKLTQEATGLVATVADRHSMRMELYAKQNAPWRDITGEARRQLHSNVLNDNEFIVVTIEHGVDYGAYLEYARSGRFAILERTVTATLPQLQADLVAAGNAIEKQTS